MFCMQCEQTTHGVGCSTSSICGKTSTNSTLQDILIQYNKNVGFLANIATSRNIPVENKIRSDLLESTFATLTNVNFDDDRIID